MIALFRMQFCVVVCLSCSFFVANALVISKIMAIRGFCRSMKPLRAQGAISDIVNVDLGDRSYPIYIGQDILKEGGILQKHVTSKKAMIVTNTKVGPIYSAQVRAMLEKNGVEVFEVVLPDGEEYKNMDELMKILDAAMLAKLDRKSTMIALGGGVIGDMTGMCIILFPPQVCLF